MEIRNGGTVSGVGQYLKSKNPNVEIYGLEPEESNILNGGKPGPHHITGNGVGFKPDILDMDIMEEVLMAESEDAVYMARQLSLNEGLMNACQIRLGYLKELILLQLLDLLRGQKTKANSLSYGLESSN
ncbi:bifunctional L-3-cyanoalanine synthase cysteine synthase 2, mitochondrial [Olea europaea subsp. europaea]|uniref:Bifunctional L-3-cyanoalanine synthase cysteine synthase 2, mitochondrial n=1 Tax=Olea europaea subsp. europaea TaxID=158383 RepID=A0A8S0PMG8_OLEEU|nr:bifunctional L-3-cyanoalanine synthase cysteine synthase 2, mitochondrial [Olea europaea subsp. europaea]